MKNVFGITAVFVLGCVAGASLTLVTAAENPQKPAYLIVSSQANPGSDYGPYSQAAGPLARDAGIQVLASGKEPVVLEGNWPYQNITLETFPSMQAATGFWYSDAYQEAKKLREGLATINFIVAIEGN
jgi:uncharacterized protein (DUF1330 family)